MTDCPCCLVQLALPKENIPSREEQEYENLKGGPYAIPKPVK